MLFDAVVGNPPYQEMDGGAQASAKPVYNYYTEQAEAVCSEYVSLIMPARWYSGGKGLDSFRKKMLSDNRIRQIHDFVNANDCFTNVEIKGGVCYFLWDTAYDGECLVANHNGANISSVLKRPLLEEGHNTFIRDNQSVKILHKVRSFGEEAFSSVVKPAMTFGFRTFYKTFDSDVPAEGMVKLYANHSRGYIDVSRVKRGMEYIGKWKVFIPEATGIGDTRSDVLKPILGEPESVSTETYVMNGPYETEQQARNVIAYVNTKFFHFMLGLRKLTQHTTQSVYQLVPMQDFSANSNIDWSAKTADIDAQLYKKYGLSEKEIAYIEDNVWSQVKKG